MIKILGAGISGLTAAINLAKAGCSVEIFELGNDCGTRFRGDLQGLENWTSKKNILEDLKSMNLELNFNYTPFKKIFISNGEVLNEFVFKLPIFYLVKRGVMYDTIDQGLLRQAKKLGVKIHFKSKINEEDVHIIATGPKLPNRYNINKGIVFETNMDDICIFLINSNAAYKGYSYLLVSKGYGCMCTVVIGKSELANKCLKTTKTIFTKLVDLKIKNPKAVGGQAKFIYKPRLTNDNKIYVGEAAGLQDAFLGFGMRYAITSGYMAAKSTITNVDYKKLVEKRFSNQLKASIVNRFLFERWGDNIWQLLITEAKKNKDPRKNLFKLYNFSFKIQKILFPLALIALKKMYKI